MRPNKIICQQTRYNKNLDKILDDNSIRPHLSASDATLNLFQMFGIYCLLLKGKYEGTVQKSSILIGTC